MGKTYSGGEGAETVNHGRRPGFLLWCSNILPPASAIKVWAGEAEIVGWGFETFAGAIPIKRQKRPSLTTQKQPRWRSVGREQIGQSDPDT